MATCTPFAASQYKETWKAKNQDLYTKLRPYAEDYIAASGALPVTGFEVKLLGTGGYIWNGFDNEQSNSLYDLSIIPFDVASLPTNCAGAPLVEFLGITLFSAQSTYDQTHPDAPLKALTGFCQTANGPVGGRLNGKVYVWLGEPRTLYSLLTRPFPSRP